MAEYRWDTSTGEIITARAAVASELTDERASTICEEFLQALGPANDSYAYSNSVFYEGKTLISRPSELDWAIIKILYSDKVEVGASRAEAMSQAAKVVAW